MPGYANDKKRTITRLRRVEGQVRAIEQMVESDTYCIDILTQIAASTSALKSVALTLLDDHMNHCVREAAEKGVKRPTRRCRRPPRPSPGWFAPSSPCQAGPIGLGILVGMPGISNRLNGLGCHRTNKKCLRPTSVSQRHFHFFVRTEGVEPSRASAHCHLKTARLPFRHVRRQLERLAQLSARRNNGVLAQPLDPWA